MPTSRRTTTSRVGIAAGHWRLDQMSSGPEVIFIVIVSAETVQVQASATRVVSWRVTRISEPGDRLGEGRRDDHVAAGARTGRHGEHRGGGRGGVGVGFFFLCLRFFFVSSPVAVADPDPVGRAAACWAWSGVWSSLLGVSSRAIPTTSTSAVPITRSRRVQ